MNLTVLAKTLTQLYIDITGRKGSICSVAGPDYGFTKVEEAVCGEGILLKFTQKGELESVGCRGMWHKIRGFQTKDLNKVLSLDVLANQGLVCEQTETANGGWIAKIAA